MNSNRLFVGICFLIALFGVIGIIIFLFVTPQKIPLLISSIVTVVFLVIGLISAPKSIG
jgi:uncharacterized membrane protein YqjE